MVLVFAHLALILLSFGRLYLILFSNGVGFFKYINNKPILHNLFTIIFFYKYNFMQNKLLPLLLWSRYLFFLNIYICGYFFNTYRFLAFLVFMVLNGIICILIILRNYYAFSYEKGNLLKTIIPPMPPNAGNNFWSSINRGLNTAANNPKLIPELPPDPHNDEEWKQRQEKTFHSNHYWVIFSGVCGGVGATFAGIQVFQHFFDNSLQKNFETALTLLKQSQDQLAQSQDQLAKANTNISQLQSQLQTQMATQAAQETKINDLAQQMQAQKNLGKNTSSFSSWFK